MSACIDCNVRLQSLAIFFLVTASDRNIVEIGFAYYDHFLLVVVECSRAGVSHIQGIIAKSERKIAPFGLASNF